MIGVQGRPLEIFVRVVDNLDSPVLGLTYNDFIVSVRKQGATLLPKTLVAADISEIEAGYYSVKLSGTDTSVLGSLLTKIETVEGTFYFESSIVPNTLIGINTPETCIVSGNIVDFLGRIGIGTKIIFTSVSGLLFAGDSFVKASTVETVPDAYGNFSIGLLRGVEVVVVIESAGLKYKITVPNQETALLKDLIPVG